MDRALELSTVSAKLGKTRRMVRMSVYHLRHSGNGKNWEFAKLKLANLQPLIWAFKLKQIKNFQRSKDLVVGFAI